MFLLASRSAHCIKCAMHISEFCLFISVSESCKSIDVPPIVKCPNYDIHLHTLNMGLSIVPNHHTFVRHVIIRFLHEIVLTSFMPDHMHPTVAVCDFKCRCEFSVILKSN